MKKIIILLITCCFSLNAYSFWIWSPKTKQWKNPKTTAKTTPYIQYQEAVKDFDKKNYKKAYKKFKKILSCYPDCQEAADAQYYLGKCLNELGKPYQAFLEYQKIIDSYPNSKKISEVIKCEYDIGEYFLNRDPKKWLGLSVYDFAEHPTLEIFKKIIDKSSYSEYASKAQYMLGVLLFKLGRFDESRDAFQKVLDNYPESEWATPAKYQLAIATSKASMGADYDSTALEEATMRLDEFIKQHPDAQMSNSAISQLSFLREREAKKCFDTASFYEIQRKYKSALGYYEMVVEKYPDTSYVGRAKNKIETLRGK